MSLRTVSSEVCSNVLCLFNRMVPSHVIVLALLVSAASAYNSGPPVESRPQICQSMKPGHGVEPMTTTSPFEVKADTCYSESVTLNGNMLQSAKSAIVS